MSTVHNFGSCLKIKFHYWTEEQSNLSGIYKILKQKISPKINKWPEEIFMEKTWHLQQIARRHGIYETGVGNHKRKNNVKRQQDKKDSKLWSGNIVRNENEIAALSRWYCNQRYKGYIMLSQASKKKKKKKKHTCKTTGNKWWISNRKSGKPTCR